MAAVTIVQHKSIDPNARLAQILNDPVLHTTTRSSLRIGCASLDTAEAEIKGSHFAFNSQNIPIRGKVTGIVLYEERAIAAQYINCNFSAKLLSTVLLSKTALESDRVLPAFCISEADYVFIK